jgi:hypothetical protein
MGAHPRSNVWCELGHEGRCAPHLCYPIFLQDHRKLTSTLVAQLLYNEIVERKVTKVKSIQMTIESRYKLSILYGKSWRDKQRSLEEQFRSFVDAYDCVVCLLDTLKGEEWGHVWQHPTFHWTRVSNCRSVAPVALLLQCLDLSFHSFPSSNMCGWHVFNWQVQELDPDRQWNWR